MAMGLVFPGWSNVNENRGYPLHDLATKESPEGVKLPEDILADANIMVPESAGQFVFVSSVAVTPGLVSVTFLATDTDPFSAGSSAPSDFVPLAAISVPRPITLYKNYAIDALYPGVWGWVAFGSGVDEQDTFSVRLVTPDAGLLCSKAARSYKDYPVTSLGKAGRVTELTGLVRLRGEGDIVIEKAIRLIAGRKREVIKFGLDLSVTPEDILREYAGPCGVRPEDRTCPDGKPLLTINGVTPDCDGNIDIIFQGLDPQVTGVQHGLVVDLPISLDDVCGTFDPTRFDPVDLCAPTSSSSESSQSSSSESSQSSSSVVPPPIITEYFDDFSDPAVTWEFMIPQRGVWGIKEVEPDEATVGISRLFCVDSEEPSTITVPRVPKTAAAGYKTFAVVRPFTSGANGHVIFGYKGDDEFWYAGHSVDPDQTTYGKLYVGHKTGDLGSSLDDWPHGLEFGYQFDAHGVPNQNAGTGLISPTGIFDVDVRVEVSVQPLIVGGSLNLVTVDWYWNRSGQGIPNPTTPFNTVSFTTGFDLDGLCGVGAVGCETHFDSFGIFNLF
jgi:hypothetical protein